MLLPKCYWNSESRNAFSNVRQKQIHSTFNQSIWFVFGLKFKNLFPIAHCIQIACLIRFQGIPYNLIWVDSRI